MREQWVALLDDHASNDVRVRIDEGVKSVVYETEVYDIARSKICEALEKKLSGQFGKIDDGIALAFALRLLFLLAFGAFGV